MDSVHFQVLFTKKAKFEKVIKETLVKVSEENDNLVNKENVDNYIELKYVKKLSNERFLIGIEIVLEDSISEGEIKVFCEYLDSNDNCEFLIKFRDKYLFNSLKKYYDEIFDIEMQLREILSFIFISTYENDCYSFLEFQKQKINPAYRGVKEEDVPTFLKNKYQNEFFYLTFNQYRQLKLPDIIKSETLINLLADSKSFKELKKNIQKLGAIKSEKNDFLEFLNRISENLESIEVVRNCVAHNREPTDEEIDNYNLAKEKLEKELKDFFRKITSACPKCGGEVETKETYSGYDSDGQPHVIYYKIQCKECNEVFNEDTIDV